MTFQNISIKDIVYEMMKEEGIIIDVRDKECFVHGHIPQAVNVSLEDIQNGNYCLPKTKTLFVCCDYGNKSTLAARCLAENGHQVYNAVGGMNQYKGRTMCEDNDT